MNDTEKNSEAKSATTPWHRWFGDMFKVSLIPLDLEVETEFQVMRDPPEADVVIIRRNDPKWTQAQAERLPDGIRDTTAAHVILEFKYSESVNEEVICQAAGYYKFYKDHRELKPRELQCFLISSRTPQMSTLETLGYKRAKQAGVYRSEYPVCRLMPLISLNDLSNAQHNMLIRLFASKKREIMATTEKLRQQMGYLPEYLINYIRDFITNLLTGGKDMDWLNMTPEDKAAMKKRWLEVLRSSFSPEDIMQQFTPEERLIGLRTEDILKGMRPEERLRGMRPEERLRGMRPEERLKGMRPEELEAYLLRIKGKQAGKIPESE